jgi:hypothetical protein
MIKSKLFATIAILPLFMTAAHADRHKHPTAEKMNNHTHSDPKAHISVFEHTYGGISVGQNKFTDTFMPSANLNITKNDFDISGLSFGIFVGKRFEIVRNIFIGAEGFYQGDLSKGNFNYKFTKNIDIPTVPLKTQPITGISKGQSKDIFGLQGSIGFTITPDLLISANLGYSWGGTSWGGTVDTRRGTVQTGRRFSDNTYTKPVVQADGSTKTGTFRLLDEIVVENNSGSGLKYGVSVEYAFSDGFMVRLSGDIHKFKYTGTVSVTNNLVTGAEPVISPRTGTLSRRNIAVSFLFSF